eukprot:CAMPEP_0174588388 /NCGR_PEP_ID=MMETSP0929-20130131/34550_1 /TAXON_ID=548131 ORGANISM="Ostreococcus mediterraneus, Strain clade-D-RCC2572" /NCGR_SAMPLE_ID=MMETSP0929 /ASSEMBLY_ACC=CAM_ASM_000573 /LENGTH=213 /DNA_ID=CAMNT_0015770505 /DNA_START=749 /DNA_END=1387 /DNA_ORIENTATION=-
MVSEDSTSNVMVLPVTIRVKKSPHRQSRAHIARGVAVASWTSDVVAVSPSGEFEITVRARPVPSPRVVVANATRRFVLLNVVVRQRAAIFKLLTREDQTLLIRRDTYYYHQTRRTHREVSPWNFSQSSTPRFDERVTRSALDALPDARHRAQRLHAPTPHTHTRSKRHITIETPAMHAPRGTQPRNSTRARARSWQSSRTFFVLDLRLDVIDG